MTKVVFQGLHYLNTVRFWDEAMSTGLGAVEVRFRNGVVVATPIARQEFLASRTTGRVAGWVHSADKSISVFMASLSPENKAKVLQEFQRAIRTGLEAVAKEFTARTGAQGKVRLPASASFTLAIHLEAKNGAPQLHAHMAIDERVRVAGRQETYATHTRELYRLRNLFSETVNHDLANRLQATFGVRVQKTEHGLRLPDVPAALCQRSSQRTQQIDAYIASNKLPNSPVARLYATYATRKDNLDPAAGRKAFEADLRRSGFRGESICHRVKAYEYLDANSPLAIREIRRVGRIAYRLARSKPSFSRNELLTRALQTAPVHQPFANVAKAIDSVIQAPEQHRIRRIENVHGQPAYAATNPHAKWKSVRSEIDYVFADREPRRTPKIEATRTTAEQVPAVREQTARASTSAVSNEPKASTAREAEPAPSKDWSRQLEKVLRSYEVIGAVGRIGLQVAARAVELYERLAKPIWRVHGHGHKNVPGSVAAMVRDLKKLPRLEAHQAAIAGMFKLNGSLEQKLRYGEFIYRQSRKPKFRIPRKSLIVVSAVEEARPRDVQFLIAKAKRAKAKVIFVERDWSRSVLMERSKTMQPGETRHLHTPEHKR